VHVLRQRLLEHPLHLSIDVLEIFVAFVLNEVDDSFQRQLIVDRRCHVTIWSANIDNSTKYNKPNSNVRI